jgi:competence protein ComEA
VKEWLNEYKSYVMLGAAAIVFGLFYWLSPLENSKMQSKDEVEWTMADVEEPRKEEVREATENIIMADIKGAVKTPGVYMAEEGERVVDLIEKAGGLTSDADASKVNFSMRVVDEMVVYIPKIGEEGGEGVAGQSSIATGGESNLVNINSADSSELETLPGIGPAKSSAIIEYREKNGPFKTIEELKNISGIGEKTFEKLKDLITVR